MKELALILLLYKMTIFIIHVYYNKKTHNSRKGVTLYEAILHKAIPFALEVCLSFFQLLVGQLF